MLDHFSATQIIAEERIRQAMEDGDFDNLPGRGSPLDLDDDAHLPPEMRLAYRILKNSGYMSSATAARKDATSIQDMLRDADEEQTRYRQIQKLNCLVGKLNARRREPVRLEDEEAYYAKVVGRIAVKGSPRRGE